jgi:hypothetical protein
MLPIAVEIAPTSEMDEEVSNIAAAFALASSEL